MVTFCINVNALRLVLIAFTIGRAIGNVNVAEESIRALLLLPPVDSAGDDRYDLGSKLLPAARLARDEINSRIDILPNHELQLIEASSGACDVPVPSNAVTNFVSQAMGLNGSGNLVGVLGLACSGVTAAISPLAGRDEIGLIQMSMATSPVFLNTSAYPHLWRVIPTTLSEVDAMIALMNEANWTSVATVSDRFNVALLETALSLGKKVVEIGGKVSAHYVISNDQVTIDKILKQIQLSQQRIIFASVTNPEASALMCRAGTLGLVWPAYAWIFHSKTISDFMHNVPCEKDTLLNSLQNTTLLGVQLQQPDPGTVLVSGKTFSEFREDYTRRAAAFLQTSDHYVEDDVINGHANAMYDEVWAFALALNKTVHELQIGRVSLTSQLTASDISKAIEEQMRAISFCGASGQIAFHNQEVQSPVNIFQVTNDSMALIGVYNVKTNSFELTTQTVEFVSDEFEVHYHLALLVSTVAVLAVDFLSAFLITIILVLTMVLSRTPQIKATSPYLSTLILVGCYMLISKDIIGCVQESVSINSEIYPLLCYLSFWLYNDGAILIIGMMLLKLYRIHRIFNHFGMLGKCYNNVSLFSILLLMTVPTKVCTILMITMDPLVSEPALDLQSSDTSPNLEHFHECNNTLHVALKLCMLVYCILLCIFTGSIAYKIRKVKRHNFKDTKATILMFFFTAVIFALVLPPTIVLYAKKMIIAVTVTKCIGTNLYVWIMIAFCFIPKVVDAGRNEGLSQRGKAVSTSRSTNCPRLQAKRSSLHLLLRK